MVVLGVMLGIVGFVAPFLAFPFDTLGNPDVPPDPGEVSRAAGATVAGVGAVFLGVAVVVVGVVLVVVGFVRHSNRRDAPGLPPRPPQPSPPAGLHGSPASPPPTTTGLPPPPPPPPPTNA